jgi:hypothetical protein
MEECLPSHDEEEVLTQVPEHSPHETGQDPRSQPMEHVSTPLIAEALIQNADDPLAQEADGDVLMQVDQEASSSSNRVTPEEQD